MVSSPAMVPTTSSQGLASSAAATECAFPGRVLRTTRFAAWRTSVRNSFSTIDQGRLKEAHRFGRFRQAITDARLDQSQLFDIARNRGLGHMDAPARQLAAKVILRLDLLGPQEVHDLRPSINLIHAILCKRLINIP